AFDLLAKTAVLPWGPDWMTCLERFFLGEHSTGFVDPSGPQLPAAQRPEQYAVWFKDGRPHTPRKIKNFEQFAQELYTWYRSVQPRSRGPHGVVREKPVSDYDWASFRKPGKNGTFLILAGLAWVGYAVHDGREPGLRDEWDEVVADVAWALDS
ncbi:hypothetical protein PHLGIDRAFT_40772, partial [Phlebiopsis gigantea 11061_1 CR5-6]